jgi:integrase
MIDELGRQGRRDWELLDAVLSGQRTIGQLYDSYSRNELDALRAQLSDVDVEPHVADWLAVLRSSRSPDTVEHYELYVRSLIVRGARFPRTELSYQRIAQWLAARPVGPSTKRKYKAALSSFCTHLREVSVLDRNPVREVKAPPASRPRMEYLETVDQVRALAKKQPEPFRTLSLLLHATGIEISVALALCARDVDKHRRQIRARGTKTRARDRIANVAEWAWPALKRHLALKHPAALLFPRVSRWTASDKHREACKALGIENYRLHDARHTYAVRAIRAGASFEVIAEQLGHADTTMAVRVYGRFKATDDERTSWEKEAKRQDAKRREAK